MKRLERVESLRELLGRGKTAVLHSGCGEPPGLSAVIAQHAAELRGTQLIGFMPMGDPPYAAPEVTSQLEVVTFFPGKGLRRGLTEARVRPVRVPMSGIPALFDAGDFHADVLLLHVSPPDDTGHVSLGVSVDFMRSVLRQSPTIIAEINPHMPRTSGDTLVPVSAIDWFIEGKGQVQEVPKAPADDVDLRIAGHVASLLRDGAVLQVGIGSLPDAVLAQLNHLKHLGLHTGIVTDAIVPLIEAGIIDNSSKTTKPGCCVTSMAAGTRRLYDFLHRNPEVEFHPCSFTHAAPVLAKIDRLCAINAALQVDLLGNVNAEQVGDRRISMPGGLPDFAAGATLARGGTSIVALRSTAKGNSNIVASLGGGIPATVGPSHVDFVVTEHGVAPLCGATRAQRAAALIRVADPRHQEKLARAWHETRA